MLTHLRIRNLALVEDVALDLPDGLVVLTGETGAGKSIVLDGLGLASGSRAIADKIRAGAEEAVVEARFDAHDQPAVRARLAEAGLDFEDGELLVRRRIGASASRAYVNDRSATIGLLRELGSCTVEIVSQHAGQELLAATVHQQLLDECGGLAEEVSEVAASWDDAVRFAAELAELRAADRQAAQRADYLRFQIEEIRAADLAADEERDLAAERSRLRHAEELTEAGSQALLEIYEAEDAAIARLGRAERLVQRLLDRDGDAVVGVEELAEACGLIEAAAQSLQAYVGSIELDPRRLTEVEERLALIDDLRRKYGDTVGEVLRSLDEAVAELDRIEGRDEHIRACEQALVEAAERYDRSGRELSDGRAEAASALQERIDAELAQLGMEGARFFVKLRAGAGEAPEGLPPGASRSGYERVEFQLAANPGEPAMALARVASGGELSRVTLALKLAARPSEGRRTLVFDEIDAGIGGGRVADHLGRRLAQLGERQQVVVVTHLPQVAARGSAHLRVAKHDSQGRATVRVERLDDESRIEEIARMLGGVEVTASVREHARALLIDRT